MSLGDIDINIGPHAAENLWLNTILHVSAMVILYYDYVLTLHREIQFLWPPHNKQGWFTIACLLNRYIPLLGYLPVVVSYVIRFNLSVRPSSVSRTLPDHGQSCVGLHGYIEWFMMLVQFYAGVLCSIRVHALYGQSRRIKGLLIFTAMISNATAAGAILASRHAGVRGGVIPVLSSFAGCSHSVSLKKGRTAAIAWAGLSLFDSMIFFLTLYKAFVMGRGIRLLDVIVRDGAMYFLVLSIMNFANIFSLRFSSPLLRSSTVPLTNVLSTTLVSRLVLNLREQNSNLAGLPTTIETELRFQAGLPVT